MVAQTRDVNKLKAILDACFHGEAELWWMNQLSNVLRIGYITAHGVEEYCKALETCF